MWKKIPNHKGDWRFYKLLNHAKLKSIFKLEMHLKTGYEKFLVFGVAFFFFFFKVEEAVSFKGPPKF